MNDPKIEKLGIALMMMQDALISLGAKSNGKIRIELEDDQWYPIEGNLMRAVYDRSGNGLVDRQPLDHGISVAGVTLGLRSENLSGKTQSELKRLAHIDTLLRDLQRSTR